MDRSYTSHATTSTELSIAERWMLRAIHQLLVADAIPFEHLGLQVAFGALRPKPHCDRHDDGYAWPRTSFHGRRSIHMNSWDYPQRSLGSASVSRSSSRSGFLKRVYGLFTASILFSAIGALVALNAGVTATQPIPPLVSYFGHHYIIAALIMFGAVFGASMVRHVKGLNLLALFGMATVIGVVIAPTLFAVSIQSGAGKTLSSSPIRDAFILSTVGFAGLTGYALTSGRDFSFMRGALTMGIFVVIGASLLNLFFSSSVFGLAISSVAVLLFGAFVLYDTSRLLHSDEDDAVGGAIQLYLNFLNIFLSLLRILSSRRD
jgi:modulator of FtsH protease